MAVVVKKVEVPMMDLSPDEVLIRNVEITRLSIDQAKTLKRVFNALRKNDVSLRCGEKITTHNRVFRWFLEQLDS
jgi:hypothetical protein